MAGNVIKSAFATLAAVTVSAGSALAQDTNLIEKIYEEMESGKKQTFEIVSTSADHRIATALENKRKKTNTETAKESSLPSS